MVERCALSGSDLNIKFRTILLTSINMDAAAAKIGRNPVRTYQIQPDFGE